MIRVFDVASGKMTAAPVPFINLLLDLTPELCVEQDVIHGMLMWSRSFHTSDFPSPQGRRSPRGDVAGV